MPVRWPTRRRSAPRGPSPPSDRPATARQPALGARYWPNGPVAVPPDAANRGRSRLRGGPGLAATACSGVAAPAPRGRPVQVRKRGEHSLGWNRDSRRGRNGPEKRSEAAVFAQPSGSAGAVVQRRRPHEPALGWHELRFANSRSHSGSNPTGADRTELDCRRQPLTITRLSRGQRLEVRGSCSPRSQPRTPRCLLPAGPEPRAPACCRCRGRSR